MGVCIPTKKKRRVADIADVVSRRSFARMSFNKKHSLSNEALLLNQKLMEAKNEQKKDEDQILKFLQVRNVKTRYRQLDSPLLKTRKESLFHKIHSSHLESTIQTIETTSLRKMLSRSIHIYNNKFLKKDTQEIENKQFGPRKGTEEFLRHHHSLEKIPTTYDLYIPNKKTFIEDIKETFPNLKQKLEDVLKSSLPQKKRILKREQTKSISPQKKMTQKYEKSEKPTEKRDSNPRTTLSIKKKMENSDELSLVSNNQNLSFNRTNATCPKIRPTQKFYDELKNNLNSSYSGILSKIQNLSQHQKEDYKVLHEGKVVVMRKNNFIVRNDKVIKII